MIFGPGRSSAGPTSRWKKLLVGVLVIGVAGAAGMLLCKITWYKVAGKCGLHGCMELPAV